MMITLFLWLSVFFAQDEVKTERSDTLKKFAELSLDFGKKNPHKFKDLLAKLRSEATSVKRSKELTSEEKKEALKKLDSEVKTVRSKKTLFYPPIGKFTVGSMGEIDTNSAFYRVTVLQVIDEETCIIEHPIGINVYNGSRDQILLMVKGVKTDGVVDGRSAKFLAGRLLEITGTETYQTISGSNTVLVLQAVSDEERQAIYEFAFPSKSKNY